MARPVGHRCRECDDLAMWVPCPFTGLDGYGVARSVSVLAV